MRKFLPLVILVVVALFVFAIVGKPTKAPTATTSNPVTISAPNETAIKGKTYEIKWVAGSGKTDIFLVNRALESEGVSVSLADRIYNVDNNGTYSYKIPNNIPGGEYQLRIGEFSSDYFTVK